MKKMIIFLLYIFSTNLIAQTSKGDLMLESESKLNFNQTVDSILAKATFIKWKVIITHDLHESLKKSGKEVLPIKVIEICNPTYSYEVLRDDAIKSFSTLMPCRISVYNKTDGKTYVSRLNPDLMKTLADNLTAKSMLNALTDIEAIVLDVIK